MNILDKQPPTISFAASLRRGLRDLTAYLAGLLLLALTAVTLVDVLGRYFLGAPLPGASELTELLVMAIVFSGLPAICLDDGHITVDLAISHLQGTAAALQLFISRFVVASILALIAWQLSIHAHRLGMWHETTIYLRLPLSPVGQVAAGLAALSAFIALALALLRLPRGVNPKTPPA